MQILLCLSLKNAIIMTALVLPTHTNGINMVADAQQTDDRARKKCFAHKVSLHGMCNDMGKARWLAMDLD